jgi:MoaA/NifB/PqqE/SkfB family radical SAM enzyme
MAEPDRQIEVQLGHLCNNRCVFCVSGQLSEQKRAPQLPQGPIADQIRAARAGGARKITFLGGEPTIQASFPSLLQLAVDLDFDEIVIFTNGVMTPRASFRERVFAVLDGLEGDVRARVIWRFSLQGGDREHHDGTTLNPGSWDRIERSLEVLHGQGARLTGNMCVVQSNYRSLPALGEVAARFGFENLHLDMVRPRDSGDRSDAELRAMMARYSDMAPYFRRLVAYFDAHVGADFDVNIGNMPYCVAPDLARKMHHDGEATITVAASGQGTTQVGFDKYLDKRVDKRKLEACADCVFDHRCGGFFEKYAEFYGYGELEPLSAERMWAEDRRGDLFVMLAQAAVDRWAEAEGRVVGRVDERAGSFDAAADVDGGRWTFVLQRSGRGPRRGGWAMVSGERVEAELLGRPPAGDVAVEALRDALDALDRALGGAGVAAEAAHATALAAAWSAHAQSQATANARRRDQRAIAQRTVEALRHSRPGGLRCADVSRSDDGDWATLRFVGADGAALELDVGLQPPERGRPRPVLRHRADGLDDARLARVNADLAAALRPTASART